MKQVQVFYAGLHYGSYDKWAPTHTLPDGCYIYIDHPNDQWYVVQHGSATPINLSDVPRELRTWLLILP